jgi:NAD(P)-dependent dehydrogenase (short-subunit alcohol dehydrogenase family)
MAETGSRHFQDRVALVTGGASGIGRALCEALARRGAFVTLADIDGRGAERAAAAIAAAGGRATGVQLDVTRSGDVSTVVRETASRHGCLDFLFNNAGITVTGEVRDLDREHWQRVLDVNLWGVLNGILAAYPLMVAQRSGHIVNTASLAGLLAAPFEVPYTATKFAVVGISEALRLEALDLGVNVSAVCPGFIRTGIFAASLSVRIDKDEALASVPPWIRMMPPDEAARQILRGVERNRAVIVITAHAKLLATLERFFPALRARLALYHVRQFRKLRRD